MFKPFYTPVEDGTYYGITHGVRAGGRLLNSLSGAFLQDYASYGYEISWVVRSHQGGVQCTGIITLTCLIFELCPLLIFILEFCLEHIIKTILAMVMKYCGWIDLIKWGNAVHMNRNSCWLNMSYCPCLFLYLNFVRSISPKLY